jgi:hypothetical protein
VANDDVQMMLLKNRYSPKKLNSATSNETLRRARAMPNSASTRKGYLLSEAPDTGTSQRKRTQTANAVMYGTGKYYSMWQKDFDVAPMSAPTSSALMLHKRAQRGDEEISEGRQEDCKFFNRPAGARS